MQVLKYEAHNVLGVKDIKFDLAGRHLFLVGGANGQGKSSALTALIMALAGKSGMSDYPEIALRKGEKRGKVTIELTGDDELMESKSITVELSLRQKPSGAIVEEFRVLDSAGEEAPEPRKLLQRLFTLRAFDPLAFERMKPKEKATLVQEMLGLDLSKFDKEYKEVFEERTVLGREGKKLAAQLEAAGKRHEGVEEVKVVELMTELEKLQGENKSRAEMEKLVKELREHQVILTAEADELVDKIAALQKKLEETKSKIAAEEKAEADASKRLEKLPDRAEDIAAVKEKIAKADETNQKVRANQELDKLEVEVKKSRGDYQKLTDRLKDIQEERAEAVASAEWPIEGMELNEDGLLMNGLPFEQASTSQRIMASVAVGMALNPKLRLLVCQHGSDLDNETLDALDAIVKAGDFQCLVEIVTRSKEDEERCAVVIADGEVVGATTAPDMEESSDTDEDSQDEK
jgi:DNA repair exonuclease SbcCD ATPase subunit